MERNERNTNESTSRVGGTRPVRPDLKDPRLVLSLLEADQVVAAKSQSRFGRRPLSFGTRAALWGLRIYVLFMMAIVVISVVQAVHGGH
ncbi:MAG TPA: hypothetical protein VMF66_08925 [Candidatus Acidoferrum sp.]|nr:hypothetical protein [Candidatus Acidoferrum sp.]